MKQTLVVTPANWFDLTRAAATAASGSVLHFTVQRGDGTRPLADVPLQELRAIHHTFGSWWTPLGGDGRPPSIEPGMYDRFLTESRGLLRDVAEAAVNAGDTTPGRRAIAAFPALDHLLLADGSGSLTFLRSFLALQHAPSLIEWVTQRAEEASDGAPGPAWLRLVFQKIGVEDRQPEILACLRRWYSADRQALLAEEALLLEKSGLQGLQEWSRQLGIDRPARTTIAIPIPDPVASGGEPDVTVLIPSFNHEAFIETAINSVLAQTHAGHRILVVDDGSTDATVARASSIRDPRVEVTSNPANLGLGSSVLAALDRVTTPYVALLNSDDLFHPERLERCLAALSNDPAAEVAATGIVLVDDQGRLLDAANVSSLFDSLDVANWIRWFDDSAQVQQNADLLTELLQRNFLITSSNIVCRTDFLRRHRAALAGLKYCLDWQVFLDAAIEGALVHLPDGLIGYRLHGSNTVWWDDRRRVEYMNEQARVLAYTLCRLPEWVSAPESPARNATLDALARLRQPQRTDDEAAGRREAAARILAEVLGEEARIAREWLAGTHASPEWRLGYLLWNRLRLGGIASRLLRAARLPIEWSRRLPLAGTRLLHRLGLRKPAVVVAATWKFPVPSHTFVYQEIDALTWAGFDYHVFCCETLPKSELPGAFERLWDRRVVLRPDLVDQHNDYEHFRRTRGERVDSLLGKLTAATGLDREALLRQPIVMLGFSFARYVELAGASYLHSYFFYDQSLMALMAAYLLAIPRGVTAYADHMMNDYQFKCVALHLELADIVVATSQRIGNELSAIGAGRFDAKILVKPNGIDTARFAHVSSERRLQSPGEPQLVSVSRIEPKKGLTYLVEAVRILADRGVGVRLHIVGGVDRYTASSQAYFGELTSAIAQQGVSDRVVLHGALQQAQFAPILAESRLFVAPYVEVASGDKDGIPTAILEAMSTGLPVVGTDAGSIREVITDGLEGFIVGQRDAAQLADAIEHALADPDLYGRMVDAARQRAVSAFDARVTEQRLHVRIHDAIARNGAAGSAGR